MTTPPGPDELELMAYADGRLDVRSARGLQIARHLERDEAACRLVNAYIAQDRAIRRQFDPVLSQPVPAPLLPVNLSAPGVSRRWWKWSAAAAAAGAAGLVIHMTGILQPTALAHDFETFAGRVLAHMQAGDADAASMGLQQLADLPALPDFNAAGFTLIDHRSLQQGTIRMLEARYRDAAGQQLRLFVGEMPGRATPETRDPVVYWQRGGRFYALTGTLPGERLGQFAAASLGDAPQIEQGGGIPATDPSPFHTIPVETPSAPISPTLSPSIQSPVVATPGRDGAA
jgi:anti-sigma factor RsiW